MHPLESISSVKLVGVLRLARLSESDGKIPFRRVAAFENRGHILNLRIMGLKERPAGEGEAGLWRILCRYTGVIAYNELSPFEKVGAAS